VETKQELQEWRESAPFWNKHANTIREMFAPVTRALIQDARISEGQVVLDVRAALVNLHSQSQKLWAPPVL